MHDLMIVRMRSTRISPQNIYEAQSMHAIASKTKCISDFGFKELYQINVALFIHELQQKRGFLPSTSPLSRLTFAYKLCTIL